MVDAADSITFRLLFNSLRAAYEPALVVLAPVLGAGETAGAYRVLTAALGEGDPDTARAAAERVLRPSTDALLTPSTPWRTDERRPRPAGSRAARSRRGADHRAAAPRPQDLGPVWREFWRHPSPWLISAFLVGSIVARVVVGGGSWWELLIPAALVARSRRSSG